MKEGEPKKAIRFFPVKIMKCHGWGVYQTLTPSRNACSGHSPLVPLTIASQRTRGCPCLGVQVGEDTWLLGLIQALPPPSHLFQAKELPTLKDNDFINEGQKIYIDDNSKKIFLEKLKKDVEVRKTKRKDTPLYPHQLCGLCGASKPSFQIYTKGRNVCILH